MCALIRYMTGESSGSKQTDKRLYGENSINSQPHEESVRGIEETSLTDKKGVRYKNSIQECTKRCLLFYIVFAAFFLCTEKLNAQIVEENISPASREIILLEETRNEKKSEKNLEDPLADIDLNLIPPMPFPSSSFENNTEEGSFKYTNVETSLVTRIDKEDINNARIFRAHNFDAGFLANTCHIYGTDNRTNQTDTTSTPWKMVVSLVMITNGNIVGGCSGAMIGSNYILTAGHCVNSADAGNPNKDYWVDEVIAYPGYDGTNRPYGSFTSDHLYSYSGWTVNRDWNYDIALIRIGNSFGPYFGYGYSSDSNTLSVALTTAGYPYDRVGMISMSASNEAVTSNLICSYLDVCSGQSGSGAWYYKDATSGHVLRATVSGYGGDCANTRLTRINQTFFEWIKKTITGCSCTSGACCDGCSFYKSSRICDDNYDVDYRCDSSACGANAQKRIEVKYCSGSSASCTGNTEWQEWETISYCNADQLCESDNSTYATCATCDNGCQSGICCECSSEECCDGCYWETGTYCDDGINCTENDKCQSGNCIGTPLDCSILNDQCNTGKCDEDYGDCYQESLYNGKSCDDNDSCTQKDKCDDGFCKGIPIDCSSLTNQCRIGYCDQENGACNIHNQPDGRSCDDGREETINDKCEAGLCRGEEKAVTPVCGNGIKEEGEQCDDGNMTPSDGCNPDCTLPATSGGTCGNGIKESYEQCDDGNMIPGDGCNPDCTIPGVEGTCGNGVKEWGEECDDGNLSAGDSCNPDCTKPAVSNEISGATGCGCGIIDF